MAAHKRWIRDEEGWGRGEGDFRTFFDVDGDRVGVGEALVVCDGQLEHVAALLEPANRHHALVSARHVRRVRPAGERGAREICQESLNVYSLCSRRDTTDNGAIRTGREEGAVQDGSDGTVRG